MAPTDEKYDVLIVGGGIVGVSLGYFLKKFDSELNVLVVEKYGVGTGATGLSAGTIWNVGYGDYHNPACVAPAITMEFIEMLYAQGYEFEYVASGALNVSSTMEERSFIQKQCGELEKRGYNVKFLSDPHQIEKHLSPLVNGAGYTPLSSHVKSSEFALAIADVGQRFGLEIAEDTEVLNIHPDYSQGSGDALSINAQSPFYSVQLRGMSKGAVPKMVKARKVVIAAGIHCNYFLGSVLGKQVEKITSEFWKKYSIVPVKGQIWTTEEAPENFLKHIIFTVRSSFGWSSGLNPVNYETGLPPFCTHDSNGTRVLHHGYGRQGVDGTINFGGGRLRVDRGSNILVQQHLEDSRNFVESLLPLKQHGFIGAFTGLMPFPMCGHPLVTSFRSHGHPNLYLAGGFGPGGIKNGPGAAKVLAAEIVQKKNLFPFQERIVAAFKSWGLN